MGNLIMKKKAFSLIELSIVLLIIGIIITGITQSSRLISAFRLSNARTVTNSSPVNSINGLVLWFEPTSKASFTKEDPDNAELIALWKDINPQSTIKNNATQSTDNNKPEYKEDCINNLPCLYFDDSDFLSFDGNIIVQSDYTIFVVEQRLDNSTANFFIAGTEKANNRNLMLGYLEVIGSIKISFRQWGNDYDAPVAVYTSPITRVHSYTLRSAGSGLKTHYVNGVQSVLADPGTNANPANPTQKILSFQGASIGKYGDDAFYKGNIAEVIIFNRALKNYEREAVEQYLIKKWGI